jgi:hypothetical protein
MNKAYQMGCDPAFGNDASAITIWMMNAAKKLDIASIFLNLEEAYVPEGCLRVWDEVEVLCG